MRARHDCEFRFYEELNDYLPRRLRKRSFTRGVSGTPAVKDAIEALGVPHTDIDLILVDGRSVRFDHRLQGGERIAVYPVFERFDITPLYRLRPRPLRNPRFAADVHLGTLARYLRLLGFDTRYRNDLGDAGLARLTGERRILLTRDVGLLKRKAVLRGHWLRSRDPQKQLREIVAALHLRRSFRPFTRCLSCNAELEPVARHGAAKRPALERQLPTAFRQRRRRDDFRLPCGRWCDERDEVAPVAPIDREVRTIERHHAALSHELGHAHDARIRQIHLAIGVFLQQREHRRCLVRQIERQHDLAGVNHFHDRRGPSGHRRRLRHRFRAGMKRRSQPREGLAGPPMVTVAPIERRDHGTRVEDVCHRRFVVHARR
jgi:hypothetical protein